MSAALSRFDTLAEFGTVAEWTYTKHGPGSMGWSMVVHGLGPWGGPWTPVHVLYTSVAEYSFGSLVDC